MVTRRPRKAIAPEENAKRVIDLGLLMEAVYPSETPPLELQIRYDPALAAATSLCPELMDLSAHDLFLLKWHWSVLDLTCRLLDFEFSIGYREFGERVAEAVQRYCRSQVGAEGPLEITLQVTPTGKTHAKFGACTPRPDLLSGVTSSEVEFSLYMDTEHTVPSYYTTLPSQNQVLDRAQERLSELAPSSLLEQRDLIMINTGMEVMGGTKLGVAFYRNGQWVTPEALCGSRLDPMREMLQSTGLLVPGTIMAREALEGEIVLVFNSVLGVSRGRIMNTATKFMTVQKKRSERPSNRVRTRQRLETDAKKAEASQNAALSSEMVQQATAPPTRNKRRRPALPGSGVFKF